MIQEIIKVISIILIIYGISIYMVKSGTRFYILWYIAGGTLFLVSEIIRRGILYKLPKTIMYGVSVLVLIGLFIYVIIACMIISSFRQTADNNPQYLIVLGAQVKEEGPSLVLKYRLDAARDYIESHKEIKVILSGGQGKKEPWSEAEGMRKYLSDINPERMILEDESMTTKENLKNSFEITGDLPVVIVTNNFHLFRARKLAEKVGYSHVSGIAAYSRPWYFLNNLTREVLAVMKEGIICEYILHRA